MFQLIATIYHYHFDHSKTSCFNPKTTPFSEKKVGFGKWRGQGQRQNQPRHCDEFEDGDHHRVHPTHGAAETGGSNNGQSGGLFNRFFQAKKKLKQLGFLTSQKRCSKIQYHGFQQFLKMMFQHPFLVVGRWMLQNVLTKSEGRTIRNMKTGSDLFPQFVGRKNNNYLEKVKMNLWLQHAWRCIAQNRHRAPASPHKRWATLLPPNDQRCHPTSRMGPLLLEPTKTGQMATGSFGKSCCIHFSWTQACRYWHGQSHDSKAGFRQKQQQQTTQSAEFLMFQMCFGGKDAAQEPENSIQPHSQKPNHGDTPTNTKLPIPLGHGPVPKVSSLLPAPTFSSAPMPPAAKKMLKSRGTDWPAFLGAGIWTSCHPTTFKLMKVGPLKVCYWLFQAASPHRAAPNPSRHSWHPPHAWWWLLGGWFFQTPLDAKHR